MVRPPYPAVVRLCDLAADRWDELKAAYYQTSLLRLKPYEYLSLVYAWAVERVPSDKREQWDLDLVDMLPWQDSQSEAALQLESDSFFKMQAKGG